MNDAEFFKALRKRNNSLFGTSLKQGQVDGLNAVLDAAQGLPIGTAAHALALVYEDTDGRMAGGDVGSAIALARPITSADRGDVAGYARLFETALIWGEWPAIVEPIEAEIEEPVMPKKPPLVTQPTAKPTRKVTAGGIAGLATVLLIAAVNRYAPGVGDMFGPEIETLAVAAVSWAASYMTKERG